MASFFGLPNFFGGGKSGQKANYSLARLVHPANTGPLTLAFITYYPCSVSQTPVQLVDSSQPGKAAT